MRTLLASNSARRGPAATRDECEALGDWQDIDLNQWTVVTDVYGHSQEFLIQNVVPEPETLLLFGSGLLGLAFVAYRRRGGFV